MHCDGLALRQTAEPGRRFPAAGWRAAPRCRASSGRRKDLDRGVAGRRWFEKAGQVASDAPGANAIRTERTPRARTFWGAARLGFAWAGGLLALLSASAKGASVSLMWDASLDSRVVGYAVY